MKQNAQNGQAIIVLVMVVAIITIMFTHVALLNLTALGNSNEIHDGTMLRIKAEGYLESAAMRYLRDSSYAGEVIDEGDVDCTVVLTNTGGLNRTFSSMCTRNGRSKTVMMQATYAAGVFSFSKIGES